MKREDSRDFLILAFFMQKLCEETCQISLFCHYSVYLGLKDTTDVKLAADHFTVILDLNIENIEISASSNKNILI